jgi:hypothetical protein
MRSGTGQSGASQRYNALVVSQWYNALTMSTTAKRFEQTKRAAEAAPPSSLAWSTVLRRWRRLELDCAGDAEAPRLGGRHHRGVALEKALRVGKVFDQVAASVVIIES